MGKWCIAAYFVLCDSLEISQSWLVALVLWSGKMVEKGNRKKWLMSFVFFAVVFLAMGSIQADKLVSWGDRAVVGADLGGLAKIAAGGSQSLALKSPQVRVDDDGARADLSGVGSWGYWLENADIQTIIDSPYDLVVIDYSFDGSDDQAYSREDIERIQESGKRVLAYLSIGEVENYRFYWRDRWELRKPRSMGPENPDWPGNYKVKYWSGTWRKRCVYPYLKKIIDAGFDGVYLDIVDAYYYWHTYYGRNVRTYANRMAKLVVSIAKYSRKKAGNSFIVCPQNGCSIIDDASNRYIERYLECIDCVGVESLFFNIYDEQDKQYRLELLQSFDEAGKLILNVEYIDEAEIDQYLAILAAESIDIVGYRAEEDAALDELTDSIYTD